MSDTNRKRYDQRARDRRYANKRSLKLKHKALDSLKDPWDRDELPNQLMLDIVVEDCADGRRARPCMPDIPLRVLLGY